MPNCIKKRWGRFLKLDYLTWNIPHANYTRQLYYMKVVAIKNSVGIPPKIVFYEVYEHRSKKKLKIIKVCSRVQPIH